MTALALSPDGRLLFAASRSLQLRCWSVESGQVLRSYRGHKAPVADMAVDASGGLLATASADRSVRVWDVDGGFCTHAFTGHRWEQAGGSKRLGREEGEVRWHVAHPAILPSAAIFVARALPSKLCAQPLLCRCAAHLLHPHCTKAWPLRSPS